MSLFDNASSIAIGGKEVISMKIGNNVLYEKEVDLSNLTIKLVDNSNNPMPNTSFYMGLGQSDIGRYDSEYVTDENGVAKAFVEVGRYSTIWVVHKTQQPDRPMGGYYQIEFNGTLWNVGYYKNESIVSSKSKQVTSPKLEVTIPYSDLG